MTGRFDPYHRWLGISPKHQPPDHYRLLRLDAFEDDTEVIRSAAERQMRRVISFERGQHRELARKILDELGQAKAVLLDDARKAEYDRQLRGAARPQPPRIELPHSGLESAGLSDSVTAPMLAEIIPQPDDSDRPAAAAPPPVVESTANRAVAAELLPDSPVPDGRRREPQPPPLHATPADRRRKKRRTGFLGLSRTEARVMAIIGIFAALIVSIFGTLAVVSFLNWREQQRAAWRDWDDDYPVLLEGPTYKEAPEPESIEEFEESEWPGGSWPYGSRVDASSDEPKGITALPSYEPDDELPVLPPDVSLSDEPPADDPRTPGFTAEQLNEALENASDAKTELDKMGGFDLKDFGHRVRAADLYKQLCEVAERVTYVDPNEPQVDEHRATIDEMLLDLGRQQSRLDAIGLLGFTFFELGEKRPLNGIMLAGTVMSVAPQGEFFATELQLFNAGQLLVTVMSRHDPRDQFATDDRIIILGAVVAEPARELVGYEGNLPQVVLAGHAVVCPP